MRRRTEWQSVIPTSPIWLLKAVFSSAQELNVPVNLSVQTYMNAKRPDVLPSPTWQLKFQLTFLYPKRPKPAAPAK